MLILDTNHFSELARDTLAGRRLQQRLAAFDGPLALTVITAEECCAGWLSLRAQLHSVSGNLL
jgi:predicted nucleic acid-binding protein